MEAMGVELEVLGTNAVEMEKWAVQQAEDFFEPYLRLNPNSRLAVAEGWVGKPEEEISAEGHPPKVSLWSAVITVLVKT